MPSGALGPSIGGSVLPKVKSLPDDVEFELAAGETLLEGALKASIPIAHACGGRAKCSTCRFWVLSGLESCPERNPAEAELSESIGLGEEVRLACQIRPEGDLTIRRLVLDETEMLPHANPGTMARREIAALQPYNPSMGLMLESTSKSLYAKGGPHEFAPSKRPSVRLKTLELAGQLRVPFTTGILIGIGESRRDRIESLLAIANLQYQYGHVQEVIIQNFLAKAETPMEDAPNAESDEFLWTVAVALLILGSGANLQVPPNLSATDYQMYLNAGINDWGGVSPLTIDFVNPEAPWPALIELKNK